MELSECEDHAHEEAEVLDTFLVEGDVAAEVHVLVVGPCVEAPCVVAERILE